jgi:hypothetical protein
VHPDSNMSRLTAIFALSLALVACDDDAETLPGGTTPPPTSTEEVGPPTSPKARVRFKGPQRLQLELARILDLETDAICMELGQYDCFALHNVALGGTDPFGVALYSPNEDSTATTPLAVERVVLAGCIERATRDLGTPNSATLFKDLAVSGGKLDVDKPAVASAIDALYTRAHQRHAKDSEVEHLRQLYRDIEESPDTSAPAQDWATLSCFTVLTTLETLFY